MRRIAIVGCGGAGKTTLATALGARLGFPVIHLDEHYWRPGWVASPTAEWRARQAELLKPACWIVDGNYTSSLDLRLPVADTIVILAFPRWRCMRGVLRRWIVNRGDAVQAPGCPERVDPEFVRWVWSYRRDGRPRLEAALAAHAHDADVIELRSPRDVTRFLDAAEHVRP